MTTAEAYAAESTTSGLAPWRLERRDPRPDDVSIEILSCGVRHTDIHFVENAWGWRAGLTMYSPIRYFDVGAGHRVEMLDIRNTGEAYERMQRGDVRYRFVTDMAPLREG